MIRFIMYLNSEHHLIYTGMNQTDGTGKEVGGGFRMGNMCIPMVDSC